MTSEAELRALMTASRAGDAPAHRELLERLSRHLRAYYKGKLARIGRNAVEAEDLVQEAVMAIHTRRHTYDPAEPLTPWVHAIARYKLIDHLRRTKGSLADVPLDEADEIVSRDDQAAAESALDVHRLLARLPDKMRSAIQYVKLDGLSVSEADSGGNRRVFRKIELSSSCASFPNSASRSSTISHFKNGDQR